MKFTLDIPKVVPSNEFLELSFKMWRSMFNLPILYDKNDKSDYVWAQGYKNERVEIFPGKLASGEKATIDANLFLTKKVKDEIKAIGTMPDARIGMALTGVHIFKNGNIVENVTANLFLRCNECGWFIPLEKSGRKNVYIPEGAIEKKLLYSAIWNLMYDKTRFIKHQSQSDPTRHIGIGSCASSKTTHHDYKEIDMRVYIKKYGIDRLKSLLNENFTWNKSRWSIDNGIIKVNSSWTEVWD
jgi:hypothetical protein